MVFHHSKSSYQSIRVMLLIWDHRWQLTKWAIQFCCKGHQKRTSQSENKTKRTHLPAAFATLFATIWLSLFTHTTRTYQAIILSPNWSTACANECVHLLLTHHKCNEIMSCYWVCTVGMDCPIFFQCDWFTSNSKTIATDFTKTRHKLHFLDFLSAVCEFWPNSLCRRDAKRIQSSSYLATTRSPLCNIGAWYSLINPHHLSTTRSRTQFTHFVLCLKPLFEWQMLVACFLSQGSVDLFPRVSHALVLSAGFYHRQQ